MGDEFVNFLFSRLTNNSDGKMAEEVYDAIEKVVLNDPIPTFCSDWRGDFEDDAVKAFHIKVDTTGYPWGNNRKLHVVALSSRS